MFVSWDETHGWTHVTPTPVFAWQPQLQTTDPQFNAAATFSIIPSVYAPTPNFATAFVF
jgi:hypothetical protein